MKCHPSIDRRGTPLFVGDVVRIVGVPDLSGMAPTCLEESLPVFQRLVGKYKRIKGFDELGCAEFCFRMGGANGGRIWHWVSIEPSLLQVRQIRAGQA